MVSFLVQFSRCFTSPETRSHAALPTFLNSLFLQSKQPEGPAFSANILLITGKILRLQTPIRGRDATREFTEFSSGTDV